MLTIRLSRIGKKKKPAYRLIISEKSKDPYGRALEILGTYDPFTKKLLNPKKERIEYWLKQGAQMSATANNLLVEKKIITGKKVTASKAKKKKKDENNAENKTEQKEENQKNQETADSKEEKNK